MLVGSGENGDLAIALDAHLQLGADQIEACHPHVAGQQAQGGNVDFGFRRPRDNGAIAVAYDDVANANRGAAIAGTLDLGSADRDVLVAAKILFDRGNEPGREHVELNGAAGEPPPQPEEGEHQHAAEQAAANGDAPDQAPMSGKEPAVCARITTIARAPTALGRRRIPTPTRISDVLPFPGRRDLTILIRHPPRASPSSVVP